MQLTARHLETLIAEYYPRLQAIPENEMAFKPLPGKWSKKEIIGHLIDSAQNNIRRFIVAQYERSPHIVYKQDDWVAISDYQHYDSTELVSLWRLLNKHVAIILKNTSGEAALRECQTDSLHTIKWLAEDYVRHLRHHLHQVLDLEPVAYP
jgi:hypothetical protein